MSDERKPVWEETWEYGAHPYASVRINGKWFVINTGERSWEWGDLECAPEDYARARLASAAPDMARALIDAGEALQDLVDEYPAQSYKQALADVRAALRKAGVRA